MDTQQIDRLNDNPYEGGTITFEPSKIPPGRDLMVGQGYYRWIPGSHRNKRKTMVSSIPMKTGEAA